MNIWFFLIAVALLATLLLGWSRGWFEKGAYGRFWKWFTCGNELEPEDDAPICAEPCAESPAEAKLRKQIAESLEGDRVKTDTTEAEEAEAEAESDEDLRIPELEAYAKAEATKRAEAEAEAKKAQAEAAAAKAEVERLKAEAETEVKAEVKPKAETEMKPEAKTETEAEDKNAIYCRLHKASSTIDFLPYEKARAVKLAYGYGESFSMKDFAAFNAMAKVDKFTMKLLTDSGEVEINAVPSVLAEGKFTLEGDCWKQEPKGGPELFLNAENRLITQHELDRAEIDLGIDQQKLLGSGAYKKVLEIQAEVICTSQTGSASYKTGYFLRFNNAQLLRGLGKK